MPPLDPSRFIGLAGVAAILLIAVVFSTNRGAIRLRIVLAAFALQAAMAALVLYLPAGRATLSAMSGGVQAVIDYSRAGIAMVFGPLADTDKIGFSFAINVLPIIIFFSALMSVLYHVGVMQRVVAWAGGALRFVIGAGKVESLVAAANVFLGQTEAPLVVRPYIRGLSAPQFFTVMTTGMASVSGSVLAAYAQMGISIEYLLAASLMSAPGGLLMAKLIMPDDRVEKGAAKEDVVVEDVHERATNVIEAAAVGAQDGLKLAVSIAGMLIAFVSLIALVNGVLGWAGGLAGVEGLTMQKILGFAFAPVMYLLNIPWHEAQAAGGIFGEKLILNEFVAFASLGQSEGLSPHTTAVLTFALCGFANVSSIAIQLGALGTLAPERMPMIAKYGFHVVLAGSLSNLMSAALAGLILQA